MNRNSNKLIIIYEEDKCNPIGTWSGIPFQLRESLKAYFEIIFIDSSDVALLRLLKTLAKRIDKYSVSFIIRPIYETLHKILVSQRVKKYTNIPILEISENVVLSNDYYLFRDMAYACYPYVLDQFKDDVNNYGHGMLKHISKEALNIRIVKEKTMIEKSRCSFYMGHWNVNLLNNLYPHMSYKSIAVGGGLSKEFVCETSKTNNKRIIFVGIDYLRKGGDLVLEAFKLLKEKYDKDAELTIAGSEINECYNSVTCVGKVSKKVLSSLFSNSSVFCMPSRFEAYGLVFLEAQCYGLPIVAYDDYEMHYLVEDGVNGYLIKKYDAEELAEALHKALNNKEMIDRVRKNAKAFKEEHSWDVVAKKIADVINERSYGVKND